MNSYEVEGQYIDEGQEQFDDVISDPEEATQALRGEYMPQQQDEGLFGSPNDLKVIQEYNREENMPEKVKHRFWSLASKSIKLGFWGKDDFQDLYYHTNIIKMGDIMTKPRQNYTFQEMQDANQMELLMHADYKRGMGMEKYKINERTLQATSVTQNIQGSGSSVRKRAGVMSGLKSFFG